MLLFFCFFCVISLRSCLLLETRNLQSTSVNSSTIEDFSNYTELQPFQLVEVSFQEKFYFFALKI